MPQRDVKSVACGRQSREGEVEFQPFLRLVLPRGDASRLDEPLIVTLAPQTINFGVNHPGPFGGSRQRARPALKVGSDHR